MFSTEKARPELIIALVIVEIRWLIRIDFNEYLISRIEKILLFAHRSAKS